RAQGALPITKLAPDVYLIVAPSGNMVAETSPSGIVVAGAQSRAATAGVVAALRTVSAAPIRYVLFTPGDSLSDEGDAGWPDRHATVVAHERMRMTAPHVTSALGFSEVLQIYLDGSSVHVVHQPPGHTKADIIVHFESKHMLYLGNAFVAKGYPRIDVFAGASIDSLIKEVLPFAEFAGVQIVPGRGAVSTAADVGAYRDMLTDVRGKVQGAHCAREAARRGDRRKADGTVGRDVRARRRDARQLRRDGVGLTCAQIASQLHRVTRAVGAPRKELRRDRDRGRIDGGRLWRKERRDAVDRLLGELSITRCAFCGGDLPLERIEHLASEAVRMVVQKHDRQRTVALEMTEPRDQRLDLIRRVVPAGTLESCPLRLRQRRGQLVAHAHPSASATVASAAGAAGTVTPGAPAGR
ncbi:MAG: hypothetical protein M3Y05_16400, partial [Gemmatimonadota bacterium]|nr:hypothetical protein [Gemmatimonadota bacterium]